MSGDLNLSANINIRKGDKLRVVAEVLRVKKGMPTKIKINGSVYVLTHEGQYSGGKKQ